MNCKDKIMFISTKTKLIPCLGCFHATRVPAQAMKEINSDYLNKKLIGSNNHL